MFKSVVDVLNNPTYIIIVGILLASFAPIIITQINTGITFGRPNEIGDTIGGITAPVIVLFLSTVL